MPTLEELKAKPGWKALSPEAQALAVKKYGAGNQERTKDTAGQKDVLSGPIGAVSRVVGDVATGVGKGALQTASTLGSGVNALSKPLVTAFGPGPEMGLSDAISTLIDPTDTQGGMARAQGMAKTQGTAQGVGAGGEHIAELMAGGAAEAPASLAANLFARAGASGLGAGAMRGAQTGDAGEAATTGLTAGALGLLPRLMALRGGAGALREGGADAASAKIPGLEQELQNAVKKGTGRGAGGKSANAAAIAKELRDAKAVVARSAPAEAAGAGAGSGEPSAIMELVKKALPYILGAAGGGLVKKLGRAVLMD